jgi:hypothetical protein
MNSQDAEIAETFPSAHGNYKKHQLNGKTNDELNLISVVSYSFSSPVKGKFFN